MAQSGSDRNLMVGVLALQLSLVNETQLLEAVKAWAFNKQRLLEDIFLEQRAIDEHSKILLAGLVDRGQINTESVHPGDQPVSRGFRESISTVIAAVHKLSDVDDVLHDSVATFLEGSGATREASNTDATRTFQGPAKSGKRFRILRPLAQGGLGQVSVAEDTELHREVALKQILPKYIGNEESRTRFLVEAEVTGRLEHPSIVPVYSLGTHDTDGPYYAMQFIRGVSFADAIQELHTRRPQLDTHSFRLELRKLIARLIDACQAIQYAHSKGVLHRDIKPKNIMLGKFGETFVVDWGLARAGKGDSSIHSDFPDESKLVPSGSGSAATRLGSMIGTIGYMSPEQADGRLDRLGPASDVFSLGATLYCILTGETPTSGDRQKERSRLDYGHFWRPSQLAHAVPRTLDAICLKSLEADVSNRYQTVAEFMEDLEAWLADEPVSAYPEPLSDRARRWLNKHRALTATLSGILATSIVALSLFLLAAHYNNQLLAQARDNAVDNHKLARSLLVNALRLDDEILSKNELTTGQIVELRLKLTQGVYETYEHWYQHNPNDSELSKEFALMARVLSSLKRSILDFKTASIYIQQSLAAHESKRQDTMSTVEKTDYVTTLIAASELDAEQGLLSRALSTAEKALDILDSINPQEMEAGDRAQKVIRIHLQKMAILSELARTSESQYESKAGIAVIDQVQQESDANPKLQTWKVTMMLNLAQIANDRGAPQDAIQLSDEAVAIARAAALARGREFLHALLAALNGAAKFRIESHQHLEDAVELLREAEELIQAEMPKANSIKYQEFLITTWHLRSRLHQLNQNHPEALNAIDKSYKAAQQLVAALPLPQYICLEAEAAHQKSLTHRVLGSNELADQWLNISQSTWKKAEQGSPESVRIRAKLNK